MLAYPHRASWSESASGGLRYAVSEYERAAATGTEHLRAAR